MLFCNGGSGYLGFPGDLTLIGKNTAVRPAGTGCREKNRQKGIMRLRYKMKKLFLGQLSCLGAAMALYAGLWTMLCEQIGMVSWIGFAGCTTYFACGKKGRQGINTAVIVNGSGVVWAWISLFLGEIWNWSGNTIFLCAWISYMIILQAEIKVFSFIPGAYIGCFITFAAGGNLKAILPALFIGVLLGWMTDATGTKVYQWIEKNLAN